MFLPDLSSRRREHEWMDAADVDPAELRRSLTFIRGINVALGYTRATLHHLERFSRTWTPGRTITLIDFATGSGDIPAAILGWAKRRGHDVRIVGVDLHAVTAAEAARRVNDPRFSVVRADVLDLPSEPASFDYALTSMFLHHLDGDQVVRVLAAMDRVARRGIIAADLLRNRRAYAWISLFTAAASPMLKHDARVSVAQAFTRDEVLDLRRRAGIEYVDYFRHFGHRFVLAGEKRRTAK